LDIIEPSLLMADSYQPSVVREPEFIAIHPSAKRYIYLALLKRLLDSAAEFQVFLCWHP